jgi:hypothetical protein
MASASGFCGAKSAATARTELGEHLGIGSPHADIDLCGPESQVEEDGRAIVQMQRLTVWSTLRDGLATVHRSPGSR